MTLRQLEIFAAIVETGTFTAAARRLYMAQPSVSEQIRVLEDELGARLFVRLKNRHVRLTEAGSILKRHADLMLQEARLAPVEIAALSHEPKGRIRIGVEDVHLASILSPALGGFHTRFPKMRVDIAGGGAPELVQMLEANRLDLAVVPFPIPATRLRTRLVLSEDLLLVVPARSRRAKEQEIEPGAIAGLPLVLYDQTTAMRRALDEYFSQAGITPNIVFELGSVEAMKSLVAADLGAALVPASALVGAAARRGLRAMRIKGRPLVRQIGIAAPAVPRLPGVVEALTTLFELRFEQIKALLEKV